MKSPYLLAWVIFMVFVSIPNGVLGGAYTIGRDEQGYFIQTDADGTWSIAPEDVTDIIKKGGYGKYVVMVDGSNQYIETDKHGEFLIDLQVDGQLVDEGVGSSGNLTGNDTSVIIDGNKVIVPIVLQYNGNETETLLLLDTGASITILHQHVADQLEIRQSVDTEIMVVGGQKIDTAINKLDFVSAGPIRKKNIVVGIVEHHGEKVKWGGLLGMNFLRGLNYRIDFENKVITWGD
jgi:predicted aspartyl protease